MKSTINKGFLLAACFAIAAAFTAWWATPRAAVAAIYRTYQRAKDWVLDTVAHAFKLAAGAVVDAKRPAVLLIQAKAFVLRLAKRERPELTSSWRMCPSC